MPKNSSNPKVDFYFNKEKWHKELLLLRKIALSCGLDEVLKWGVPCYAIGKKNIVLIHVFKEYCAYLFFKGSLMADPENILIQQTENVQVARQIRFTNTKEIKENTAILKAYIFEAIEIEKSGTKPELKKTTEFEMAAEFQAKLDDDADLKTAFEGLTSGRRRAYLLHFSSAKQAKTREARIEKCKPQILKGIGLND
ncbi:MAG: YdeI/OmpD-associated family protein [Chitinophagaceae bacterium]